MTTYRPTLDEHLHRPMPPSRTLLWRPEAWNMPRVALSHHLKLLPPEQVRRRCFSLAWEVERRPWRRSVSSLRMAKAQQLVLARRLLLRARLAQDRVNSRMAATLARLEALYQ